MNFCVNLLPKTKIIISRIQTSEIYRKTKSFGKQLNYILAIMD